VTVTWCLAVILSLSFVTSTGCRESTMWKRRWKRLRYAVFWSRCATSTHSLSCFSPMKADSSKYGRKHQNERRRWQSEIDAGRGVCAICGRPIARRAHWSLIRDLGPAHTRCGFVQGKLGKTTSRDW